MRGLEEVKIEVKIEKGKQWNYEEKIKQGVEKTDNREIKTVGKRNKVMINSYILRKQYKYWKSSKTEPSHKHTHVHTYTHWQRLNSE